MPGRTMTAAAKTASKAEVVTPVILVDLDFSGGAVRANSSPYTISYDGDDFLGVGNLGGISQMEEGVDMKARGISLTLSGIPTELVATALDEDYQGRDCKIWLAFLDSDHQLISDPVQLGPWRMDVMNVKMGTTATIQVTAESRMADWDRARVRRYTNDDQQDRFPGDKGFDYVAAVAEKEIVWGRA